MNIKRSALVVALVLAVIGSVVLVRSGQSPTAQELYYGALEKNLVEDGLTCTITKSVDGTKNRQAISMDLKSAANLRSVTMLKQPESTVSTEQIANKTDEYVRYTAIETTKKPASDQSPDFSRVLNVWGTSSLRGQTKTLFGTTALGNCIVPLAHLSDSQAESISAKLRTNTVFRTDFGASRLSQLAGNSVRSYDVTIEPQPYIQLMKQIGAAYGRQDLESVNIAEYEKKQPEKMKFTISMDTKRLMQITFPGTSHTVRFSDFGTAPEITVPKESVSLRELENRLKEVNNSKL